tara:strand:+ start:5597 stop:7927 length:2331 start_codon:yes stop_codon:yes gene_type:complete
MGFIEQMLGMETPPKANPYGRQLMDRGSVTAEPAPEPTLENALMNSPLGTFLQYKAADVPGKLQSGLQAVGDSYKKAIDNSMRMGPTVMSGTAPPEATDQYNKANLELVADMAGSGAFSEVPKGALRMFGGVSAKTADKAALQQAQELTAKGADRAAVWKETGWYKDVDGQWKFEIDDSASFLETPAGAPKGYQRLQHDELQGAYPGMWGETQQSISRGKSAGNYRPKFRTVTAKGPNNAERRSVANHEFQHATQREEGFATGGSPYQFGMTQGELDEGVKHLEMTIAGRRWIEYQRHVGQDADWGKFRNIFKENMGKFPPIDAKNAPDNMYEELVKTEDQLRGMVSYASDPYESYRRLAGEAEARNVQTRMDYTPEQRRATPPWDTLDVPEDELIVRMGGDGQSMSAGPKYLTDQEQAEIAVAQAKTFGYKTRDEYFQEAAETGRMIDAPWRAAGPLRAPEDIANMEAALKHAPVDQTLYQPRNVITPEDIPIGSIMTPAGGDGSGIQKILNTVEGPTNIAADGGSGFMQLRDNPVWASLHGNLANLENVGKSNLGKDKYAITSPMGPDSMNFNNMMNAMMSEQMRTANILKKDIKEFNKVAKSVIPKDIAKTFPGIDAPNLEKWMQGIPGKWRGAILKSMDQVKWRDKGFPDIGNNRAAVSRDSVRWIPQLKDPMMGYNVTKMKEGALRTDDWGNMPAHGTYGSKLPGDKYMGGMDVLYPRSTVFPTHQQKIVDAGVTGSPEQGSWRGSRIEEEMTPQLQDSMMTIRELILGNR